MRPTIRWRPRLESVAAVTGSVVGNEAGAEIGAILTVANKCEAREGAADRRLAATLMADSVDRFGVSW